MTFDFGGVNWWAVLVAAVVTFVIGGIWYGAVFAKAWVRAHGFSDEQIASMSQKQGRNFGIFFAVDLVMAVVISLLVINLEIVSAGGGALLGFMLWLGIAATTRAAKWAACDKSLAAYAIDAGHELVCIVVMAAILGGWR